jgi:adenylyl-sulfate kinase
MMTSKQGFTLWLTGLSGAGKTTLASHLATELSRRGIHVEVLDGDEVRTNLSKGLGFSKEDRDINIRRIGYVCRLLSRNGVATVSAAISPYRAVRDEVRRAIEQEEVPFIEVFVKCPISVLAERDVKGLYKEALAGRIQGFTGISDPYEEPLAPDVVVETDRETADSSSRIILRELEQRGLIPEGNLVETRVVQSVFSRRWKTAKSSRRVKSGSRRSLTILKRLFLKKPIRTR